MKKIFTICFLFLLCSRFSSFSQCLSGTYTIGPIAANYVNFTNAINDLVAFGICGPVEFLVTQETYTEQLNIPFIQGVSDSSRIVFKSDPANINRPLLGYSPSNLNPYVLLFDSAKYITFDGLWLNYNDPGVGPAFESATVLLRNSASHITITNCELYAGSQSSRAKVWSCEWYPVTTSFSDNELSNCEILLGDVKFRGDLIASGNNRIKNNYFGEGSLLTMETMSSFEISDNTFQNVIPSSFGPAIFVSNCDSSAIITRNKLIGEWSIGIRVNTSYTDSTILMSNNMITCGGTTTGIQGINLFNVNNAKIYNNNVSIYNTALPNYDAAFYIQGSTNIDLKNNIFSNFAGNLTMYITQGTPSFISNNNNLFSNGSSLIKKDGTTFTNLAAWQSNPGTPRDQNSFSVNPLFTDTNDLHVNQQILKNKAAVLADVVIDIDREPRNLRPDIGADEFSAVTDSVWPGDTNDDGISDASDLIPIGIYFNEQGPGRVPFSNSWVAYQAQMWNVQVPNFNDAKFADCNGDGIVNLDDTLALTINGGLSHPLRMSLAAGIGKKHAFIHFQNDTINSGSYANVNFDFDTSVGISDSIYAFQLSSLLNPSNVLLNTIYTDKAIPTWGTYANNYVAFSSVNTSNNKYDLAATSIDYQNKLANQNLLHFGFKILNQTGQGFWYKLPVNNFNVYDKTGAKLDYRLMSDSVFVTTVTGINENSLLASELYKRSNDKIILSAQVDHLSIFDLTGRLILERNHLQVNDEIVLPTKNSNLIILQFEKRGELLRDKIFVVGKN